MDAGGGGSLVPSHSPQTSGSPWDSRALPQSVIVAASATGLQADIVAVEGLRPRRRGRWSKCMEGDMSLAGPARPPTIRGRSTRIAAQWLPVSAARARLLQRPCWSASHSFRGIECHPIAAHEVKSEALFFT